MNEELKKQLKELILGKYKQTVNTKLFEYLNASKNELGTMFYIPPLQENTAKRGEYSVSVFNSYASVLLQQNGKIIEYKINDQQTSTNTPKYNYFGAAESIGGIPIEYNYNRSVNRIGDVQFTYDFEGFIKTIGNSTVLYNSRSRISQVDNIFINYNGTEAVNVSPANTGKVYLSR